MITHIFFNNMARTEERVNFAKEHLERVLSKYDGYNKLKNTIRIGLENKKAQNGNTFHCDVQVQGRRFPTIVLKKRGENFYQTIALTADRLGQLLSKIHEKQSDKRKKRARHLQSYFQMNEAV